MSKPHLNKESALPIIRKAYLEKKLQAQNVENGMPNVSCQYRDGEGNACAIGQLIDDETAARWDKPDGGEFSSLNITMVIERNLATVEAGDKDWFAEVQDAHDEWVQSAPGATPCGSDKTYEEKFRSLIGL
jgi:hypothetical protein